MAQNNAHSDYTNAEYLEMFRSYVRMDDNCRRASANYAILFPNSRHPDHRVIRNVVNSLQQTGCVNPRAQGRQPVPVNTPQELENLIITAFTDDPNLSTRVCAIRFETNHVLVHRTLVKNGWYTFHYRRVQGFRNENDFILRMNFCNIFIASIIRNPALPMYILWSDECSFTRQGMFNSKNYVLWSDQGNPHPIREQNHQDRFTVNVWCGLLDNCLVIIT